MKLLKNKVRKELQSNPETPFTTLSESTRKALIALALIKNAENEGMSVFEYAQKITNPPSSRSVK